jgi:hypothetical protein
VVASPWVAQTTFSDGVIAVGVGAIDILPALKGKDSFPGCRMIPTSETTPPLPVVGDANCVCGTESLALGAAKARTPATLFC